jgi:hypothetical protein
MCGYGILGLMVLPVQYLAEGINTPILPVVAANRKTAKKIVACARPTVWTPTKVGVIVIRFIGG